MSNVAIIGYSGHAFVVLESLIKLGFNVVGYFETEKKRLDPYGLTFLGLDSQTALDQCASDTGLFVTIGDNSVRSRICERINENRTLLTIIDPLAQVSSTATVEKACFLAAGSSVGPLAEIGEGAIINTSAIIEHGCSVGSYAHVAPGAVLAGDVKIGAGTFVGANSVIRQGVEVGDGAIVGAGAVVVANVPAHITVIGNPAKAIRR